MEASAHVVPDFTLLSSIVAVLIAIAFIVVMSFVREPARQKINAIIIAGAGSVYWNSGLGVWEFLFGSIMLFVAFKGLKHYYFIGIGWLLHTGWDIMHHLFATPIVYLEPSSSAGCAVCDPILALWFFLGAPTIWNLHKKQTSITL
ncbi:MAG: hypothetical protein BGO40_09060 [Chryseobacterium sp. 39-10]|nr:MAG: hypothetical protein BGO40_09060 [Chryseobacterium sp. 39-10]